MMQRTKTLVSIVLWGCLGAAGGAVAQTPQFTIRPTDGVAETTVVPVQHTPAQLTVRSVVDEFPTTGSQSTRSVRRMQRREQFAARVDSLIASRDYRFYPNSMQSLPGGMIRDIYNGGYSFGLYVDQAAVHLPAEQGSGWLTEAIDVGPWPVEAYRAEAVPGGWLVTMRLCSGTRCYSIALQIASQTGETILVLRGPQGTMRYVGALWNGRWAGDAPRTSDER